MIRFFKLSLGSVLVAVGVVGGLGGLNLYTYHRFTDESPIATLRFHETGDRTYRVRFEPVVGKPSEFQLAGDEWQMDVRMIKWTDWLTFLGEEPLYRLDRISGRYIAADEARNNRPELHDLSAEKGFDVWAFARQSGDWLPGVDAAYGSSVYLPMGDGLAFEVSISRTGLLARKLSVGERL